MDRDGKIKTTSLRLLQWTFHMHADTHKNNFYQQIAKCCTVMENVCLVLALSLYLPPKIANYLHVTLKFDKIALLTMNLAYSPNYLFQAF